MSVLTVQAKRRDEPGWMTWVHSDITGPVYSLADVLVKAAKHGCDPRQIRWPDNSYQQMVDEGVAPADPPPYLTHTATASC